MKIDLAVKNQLQEDTEITVHNLFPTLLLANIDNKPEYVKQCLPLALKMVREAFKKEIAREQKFNDLKLEKTKL